MRRISIIIYETNVVKYAMKQASRHISINYICQLLQTCMVLGDAMEDVIFPHFGLTIDEQKTTGVTD